jgi:hypothetical protein
VDGFVLREEWGKVIAEMSPRNVEIVRLRAQGYSAKEVIELMQNDGIDGADELTVANVNQVYSRFKRDSRDSLAGDSGNA